MRVFTTIRKNASAQKKFDYIKSHFKYNKDIANNVKIYNLGLSSNQINEFIEIYGSEDLCTQLYDNLSLSIDDYIEEYFPAGDNVHDIGFDGRSGGYLSLYEKSNRHQADEFYYINNFDSFEELVNYFYYDCNYYKKEALQDARYLVNTCFDLVYAFDRVCDALLKELVYILDNATIEEEQEEVTTIKTYKVLCY